MIAPRLLHGNLPEGEHGAARQIENNLGSLGSYVEVFRAALALFDFAETAAPSAEPDRQKIIREWAMIALRDGAMSLYHFGKVWQAIPGLVRQSPTINALIASGDRPSIGGAFEKHFPHWAGVRKAVAHRGDFGKDEANIKENSTTEAFRVGIFELSGGSVFATDMRAGRIYFATVDGKSVQYELSEDTLRKLAAIRDSAFATFEKVEIAITGLSLGQLLRAVEQLRED